MVGDAMGTEILPFNVNPFTTIHVRSHEHRHLMIVPLTYTATTYRVPLLFAVAKVKRQGHTDTAPKVNAVIDWC
jgi:hypothetical protein